MSPLIALAVMDLISIIPNLFESIYVPTAGVNECLIELQRHGYHLHNTLIQKVLKSCREKIKFLARQKANRYVC